MFGFSFGEILVISLVTLVAVGPQKLPGMLKTMGQWARKLRKMTMDVRQQTGIDEMLRAEGIQLSELRSLMRGYHGAPVAAPAAPAPAAPRYEDPYANVEPDPTREYPPEGADAYGALPDDLLEPAPSAAKPEPAELAPSAVPASAGEAAPLPAPAATATVDVPSAAAAGGGKSEPTAATSPSLKSEPKAAAAPPAAPVRTAPPPAPVRTGPPPAPPRPSGTPPPPPRRSAAPPRPEPSIPVKSSPAAATGTGTDNGNG